MTVSQQRSVDFGSGLEGFGLEQLKARLPESALESLAREVLSRIGTGADRIEAHVTAPTPINATVKVDAFCDALTSLDPSKCRDYVTSLRADGADFASLYLGLLTPAARELGERWEEDTASFVEVSMGIGRIYSILHELRDLQPICPSISSRHAVFATLPGEEHTLGATIATDLFRERGWDVDLLVGINHDDLVEAIHASSAPVLGISAATADDVAPLLRLVMALHVHRPALRIFVAGHIVNECPNIADIHGIDGASAEFEAAYYGIEALFADAFQTHARSASA